MPPAMGTFCSFFKSQSNEVKGSALENWRTITPCRVEDADGAYFRQVGDLDAVVQLARFVGAECVIRIRHHVDLVERIAQRFGIAQVRGHIGRRERVERVPEVGSTGVVLDVQIGWAVLLVGLGHTQSDAHIVGNRVHPQATSMEKSSFNNEEPTHVQARNTRRTVVVEALASKFSCR